MELSLCHTKTHNLCPSIPTHEPKNLSNPSTLNHCGLRPRPWKNHGLSLRHQSLDHKKPAVVARCVAGMGCSSGTSVNEIERELEAEMLPDKGTEWLRDKCGGRGVVELLECLEREAIMGEDEGKEPNDYNRRAQIFYKSSRIFQALKEQSQS